MRGLGRLRCRWLHRTAKRVAAIAAVRVWRCADCGRLWWQGG